jgi:adenylyl-sulfate kinase
MDDGMTQRQGFTVWFTGLPGSGKSTLALALREALLERGHRVEVLDGDSIRAHLSSDLGFSKGDRDTNNRRVGFIAALLSRNGVVAISATISPYRETRLEIRRQHAAPFVEVFLECAIEELVRRDRKGLYAKALRGEISHFTGVSDPYEPPLDPEVHLHTDEGGVSESLDRILRSLEARALIEPSRAGA